MSVRKIKRKKEVEKFIGHFAGAEDVFLNGCCYWFAYVLLTRFNGTMMYDQKENHFGSYIGGYVYDITGDVTSKYDWMTWNSFSDDSERKRIVRDCIFLVEDDINED